MKLKPVTLWFRRLLNVGLYLAALITALTCWYFLRPINIQGLNSQPNPVILYEDSLKRIESMRSRDDHTIAADGHLIFKSHGLKTSNVIVFFHGSTNSPRQFAALAQQLFDRGYNIFIPRIPHHGLKDRMTEAHAKLTAEEMVSLADETLDIAAGLGERVTVVGLSLGGNIASWVAQNRPNIERVVIISPFWGWKEIPSWFLKPSINFLSSLPNLFIWWDRKEKMALGGPTSTYYRFSTRGLAQIMRLGWCVFQQAQKTSPQARSIMVISNASDEAVNLGNIEQMVTSWSKYKSTQVERFEFENKLGLSHDLIDPEQPFQKTDQIYPQLISLITANSN